MSSRGWNDSDFFSIELKFIIKNNRIVEIVSNGGKADEMRVFF